MSPSHLPCFSALFMIVLLLSTLSNGETIIATESEFENGTITCEENRSCIIYCEQPNSCMNAEILCPSDQPCIISCGVSPNACYGTTIDARYSSLLELNDCQSGDDSSCHGVSIYFPPHRDGQKVAYLNTGDNMKQALHFYAIYGWLDIDTSGFIGGYNGFIGEMHCSFWYQSHCNFHSDQLSCAAESDLCNNPHLNGQTTPVPLASANYLIQEPISISSTGKLSTEMGSMWYIVVAVLGYLCCCSLVAMFWINRHLQRKYNQVVELTTKRRTQKSNTGNTSNSKRKKKFKKKKPHILSMDGDHETHTQTQQTHSIPLPLHQHLRHNRERNSNAKYTAICEQEQLHHDSETESPPPRVPVKVHVDPPHKSLAPRARGDSRVDTQKHFANSNRSHNFDQLQLPAFRRQPNRPPIGPMTAVQSVQSLADASKLVHCDSDARSHLTIERATECDSTRTTTTCTDLVNSCNSFTGVRTGDVHTAVTTSDLTISPSSETTPSGYGVNAKTVTCSTSVDQTETTVAESSDQRTAVRVSTLHPMSNDSWFTRRPHGRPSRTPYTISRDRSRVSTRSYRHSTSREWSDH